MTDVELREHVLAIMDERDQRYLNEFQAIRDIIIKAETNLQHRLEAMNEIRGAMSDMSNRMMTRSEYTKEHASLVAKVDAIRDDLRHEIDVLRGRSAGMAQLWGWIVGVVALLLSGVAAFIHFRFQ